MAELAARTQAAREKGRAAARRRMHDLIGVRVRGPYWDAVDRLIVLEREEAAVIAHLDGGGCAGDAEQACAYWDDLKVAIEAIEQEDGHA